jgi:hypothetical protein
METSKQLRDDLDFLGGILRKSRGTSPFAMYLMWAVLVLVGFALVDFAPRKVGIFWIVAGPLGGVASAFLGMRHARKIGQLNREEGTRHAWHWAGLMVAILLAVPLGVAGAVDWPILSRIFLLIIGLAYYLAGVHMEKPLLWAGGLMLAGYLALFFIPAYGWTMIGVLVAASLLLSGYAEGRRHGTPSR